MTPLPLVIVTTTPVKDAPTTTAQFTTSAPAPELDGYVPAGHVEAAVTVRYHIAPSTEDGFNAGIDAGPVYGVRVS